jgi:hypothetical protein
MKSTKATAERVDIYTAVPGAEIMVGKFGVATNTCPCSVPADYAEKLLAGSDEFKTTPTEPAAEDKPKKARKGEEK